MQIHVKYSVTRIMARNCKIIFVPLDIHRIGRCEITYLANAKSVLSRALFNRAFAFSLYREIIRLP